MVAAHLAGFYPVETLVGLPGLEEGQLATIKRHHRRLGHCLSAEMIKRLGYIGLVMGELNLNIALPPHLQSDVEELWRLQKFQDHLVDLAQLELAQAMGRGQPVVNLVIGHLAGQVKDDKTAANGTKAISPFNYRGVSGKNFLN